MTAPERIWATRAVNGYVATDFGPQQFLKWPEYILHTRAALAASPLVQEIVADAVKAERDACAKVCETLGALGGVTPNPRAEWKTHADNLAAAIRARGEGQPQDKGE